MSKEDRDREIERIVDIAAADENRRLEMELCPTCQLAGLLYCPLEHRSTRAFDPIIEESNPTREVSDDYRAIIEAPAVETEPAAVALVHGDIRRGTMRHVDEIRRRVPGMPGETRSDAGYLLEVIDAFDQGRL